MQVIELKNIKFTEKTRALTAILPVVFTYS